jgi:hypothetical protein
MKADRLGVGFRRPRGLRLHRCRQSPEELAVTSAETLGFHQLSWREHLNPP